MVFHEVFVFGRKNICQLMSSKFAEIENTIDYLSSQDFFDPNDPNSAKYFEHSTLNIGFGDPIVGNSLLIKLLQNVHLSIDPFAFDNVAKPIYDLEQNKIGDLYIFGRARRYPLLLQYSIIKAINDYNWGIHETEIEHMKTQYARKLRNMNHNLRARLNYVFSVN